jgi:hypothetical protein
MSKPEVHIHAVVPVPAYLVRAEIAGGASEYVLVLHHEGTGSTSPLRVTNDSHDFVELPADQGRAFVEAFGHFMETRNATNRG